MTGDERTAQWRRWLESVLGEVQYMLHSRRMYTEVWEIIEANEGIKGPNAFYAWLNTIHAGYAAAAVRRQLDMDRRSVSMAKLLTDVSQHPSALSRERYATLFPAHLRKMADEQFDRLWAHCGCHVDPEVPRRDLQQLRQSAERVTRYVNKRIAHTDLDADSASATYKELNSSIDLLAELATKYHNLLTGETYLTMLPAVWSPWKKIFRQPWIAPSGSDARSGAGPDP